MNILWIIKYSIYFHKLLSLNKFDRIRCLFCTNFKDEDSDLKKNSKVHDMKTKRRPIWMKIGSFWPLNLRRWINFLKVCVYYSLSWYTYVDILFTHHHYPESWESIPYINLLHGNYTHKYVQHTVLVWTFAIKTLLIECLWALSVHGSTLMFLYDAIFGTLDSYKKSNSVLTPKFILWVRFHIA